MDSKLISWNYNLGQFHSNWRIWQFEKIWLFSILKLFSNCFFKLSEIFLKLYPKKWDNFFVEINFKVKLQFEIIWETIWENLRTIWEIIWHNLRKIWEIWQIWKTIWNNLKVPFWGQIVQIVKWFQQFDFQINFTQFEVLKIIVKWISWKCMGSSSRLYRPIGIRRTNKE